MSVWPVIAVEIGRNTFNDGRPGSFAMVTEEGQVVGLDGRHAWVATERRTACGSCAVSKGCGTSIIARLFSGRQTCLRVINPISARIGDRVIIAVADEALLRSSFMAYLFPLLTMFAGALCGQLIQRSFFDPVGEGAIILGALAGLALGIVALRRFARRVASDGRYEPRIVESISVASRQTWPILND